MSASGLTCCTRIMPVLKNGTSSWQIMLALSSGPRQSRNGSADITAASESITKTSAPDAKSRASANSLAHSTRAKLPRGSVHCVVCAHGTLTCAQSWAVSLTSNGTSSTPRREASRCVRSADTRPILLAGTTTSWRPIEASSFVTPLSVSRSQVLARLSSLGLRMSPRWPTWCRRIACAWPVWWRRIGCAWPVCSSVAADDARAACWRCLVRIGLHRARKIRISLWVQNIGTRSECLCFVN